MCIFLKSISVLFESTAIIVLSLLFSLSVYAIYDNNQVFSDAESTQEEMLMLKPDGGSGDKPPDFNDLQEINADVCGWITVDGTNIDYPILQGSSNLTYLNKDVYGNFSLAGSIFLDASNDYYFRDRYSLTYGHHMDNHLMYGDLDLFKDADFFEQNRKATLLTKKETVSMQVLALMETIDSTEEVFNPTMWGKDVTQLVKYIDKYSMYVDPDAYKLALDNIGSIRILGLATCTDGATGNRTILFLIAKSDNPPDPLGGGTPAGDPPADFDPPGEYSPPGNNNPAGINRHSGNTIEMDAIRPPAKTGDKLSNSPYFWLAVFVGSTMSLMILFTIRRRQS